MTQKDLRFAFAILLGVGVAMLVGAGGMLALALAHEWAWPLVLGSGFLGGVSLWAASGIHVALKTMGANNVG